MINLATDLHKTDTDFFKSVMVCESLWLKMIGGNYGFKKL